MQVFTTALAASASAVSEALGELLPARGDLPEARLHAAMRYVTLGGGKRIRPFLALASSELFEVPRAYALRCAAAVEMVHCYSLVHDDLPAMDNDDLRRGRATCHIEFDEATAILAGDALLTEAFVVLAAPKTHPIASVRAELVLALGRAAGHEGMVGGQMLDLLAEHKPLQMHEIARLQGMKTGMLIAFACESGAILGQAPSEQRHALHAYAHDLGLAFQIADDLLDAEGAADDVGKKTGKDAAAGKATFLSLLGVERARAQAEMLRDQAIGHLEMFGSRAEPLSQLARYVLERRA